MTAMMRSDATNNFIFSLLSDLWTACKDLKDSKVEAPILQPTYVRLVCWLMRSPWQILVCSEAWDVLTMSCYWFPTRYFLLSLLHLSWRLYDSCRGTQPHYYPPDPPGNPLTNPTITTPSAPLLPNHDQPTLLLPPDVVQPHFHGYQSAIFGPCEKMDISYVLTSTPTVFLWIGVIKGKAIPT